MRALIFAGLMVVAAPFAFGEMVITEWMYSGSNGEFVEFTNVGATAIDMTGWSFDDSSATAGTIDLSAFGVVQPGESVILTETLAADFATAWGLADVSIVGELSANLGRNDQLNLYDTSNNLVDQLSYGDEDYPGTPRTQYASCSIPDSGYNAAEAQTSWSLSTIADAYGAWLSTGGDIASPGRIVGYSRCDYDRDGDVDIEDFACFAACMTGSGVSTSLLPTTCNMTADSNGYIPADADQDDDVDFDDYEVFESCFGGADVPSDPSCGYNTEPSDTVITLNGTSISVDGSGVTVNGTTATITAAGAYSVVGVLDDGQIAVNTAGKVAITLNGINITNTSNAPLAIMSVDDVEIILADQTTNVLTDAAAYVFPDPNEDEPSGCLFSKDSMVISGTGTLNVFGNNNDGIVGKDDLVITGGIINVNAIDDGIRGKDYLIIQDGDINVVSGGDALKSDEDEDAALGYISIEGGTVDITAGGDGLAGETAVYVTGGELSVVSGGGHNAALPDDLSAKAIKGLVEVVIDGGSLMLDCADDGIHSNSNVTINGGTITIATGDDGVHADELVEINGGDITVTDSYEGIEGADIIINDGVIHTTSSDDGLNGAGGDGSGGFPFPGPGPGGGDHTITINGGYIVVDADGDGIDVNGNLVMTGGTVIVHGPTQDFNGALDYDGTFEISGGYLVAVGSAQMAQAPGNASTQRSVKVTYSSTKAAGTLIHFETTAGEDLLTFAPLKNYRSCVLSTADFQTGISYRLYRGGSSTGVNTDGLYDGGVYTAGTLTNTFTTSNIVTNISAP